MAAPPPPRALSAEPMSAPVGPVGVSLPRPRARVLSAQPREVQLPCFLWVTEVTVSVLVDAVVLGAKVAFCCRFCYLASFA